MYFVVVTLFHLYLIYIWLSFFLENLKSMMVKLRLVIRKCLSFHHFFTKILASIDF